MNSGAKAKQKPKRHKVRIRYIIISGLIAIGIVVPITLLSINWTNLSILYATGSSSVFPLMKKLSEAYQKESKNSNIDLMIEATGSGTGLEKILSSKTMFGNISFSPAIEDIKAEDNWAKWQELQIKTITLGIDGIALVYKADLQLDINNNNIVKIYEAFSGTKSYTFKDLGATGQDENHKIIPFAKTGGKNKSGTADAFLKASGLQNANNIPNDVKEILTNGKYVGNVKETKESQPETWKQILDFNEIGAISYFSTGFVLQNKKHIEDNGFKIATYNTQALSEQNISNGNYGWRRMLNTLISLKKKNDSMDEWLNWFINNYSSNKDIKQAYADAGIIQLSSSQFETMKDNNNFWISDADLLKTNPSWTHFGAQWK